MAEAKTKKGLAEIEIPEPLSHISGNSGVLDYLEYTEDLMDALIMGLTAEESVCHSLAIFISERLKGNYRSA